jgi:hypothetical protein
VVRVDTTGVLRPRCEVRDRWPGPD